MAMSAEFRSIFESLRQILQKHAANLTVKGDAAGHYCLEASPGPATLQAWGGKVKKPTVPVAWVQVGKAYVSYHLMGIYENTALLEDMSKELKARMQGKTCFNFKTYDAGLFEELDPLTAQSIASFRKAGFITEPRP